jgi:hypothetical protein
MIKRGSKKADTNMLWIVIGLILILVVVVVVLFFFAKGTTNFADIFTNIFRKENIDTVKSGCEVACSTNAVNDWCSAERQITFKAIKDYSIEAMAAVPATTTTTTPAVAATKAKLIKAGSLMTTKVTCDSWANNKQNDKTTDVSTEIQSQITSCSSITCPTA